MASIHITRRPLPLFFVSVLNLGGIAAMSVSVIWMLLTGHNDIIEVLAAIFVAPWLLGLGIATYFSVFRQSRKASASITIGYFLLAGFVLFAMITNVGEAVQKGEKDWTFLFRFSTVFLAISAYLTLNGILSWSWLRQLRRQERAISAFPVDLPGPRHSRSS